MKPGPRKVLPDRIIYESRSSFGPHALGGAILTDFGLAQYGDVDHNEDIQPDEVRAPEVVIEAPWSYPADIWNLAHVVSTFFPSTAMTVILKIIRSGICSRTSSSCQEKTRMETTTPRYN